MRVLRATRAQDDGYRSGLAPGLRASDDADRLAREIAFASGRLLALAAAPPGSYGEAGTLAASDLEQATWMCFLIAYLSPLDGQEPFAGIRTVFAASEAMWADGPDATGDVVVTPRELATALDSVELADVAIGPRSSHAPARGAQTLTAYLNWADRTGGSQAGAFLGDPAWSPERRFERLFERLAVPGFGRAGRYELLVILGRLGLYELRPDSLHLAGARGMSASDQTTLAAKRVFGIGDPLLLERRAATLAQEVSVPIETLDLALSNWAAQQRATLGFAPDTSDADALVRAREALSP